MPTTRVANTPSSQTKATGRIPFAFGKTEEAAPLSTKTRIPNKETLKVFKESDAGIGWNYAKDAKDLFKQLEQETPAKKRSARTPNAETLKAFEDSEAGIGLTSFNSTEAMFAHLDTQVK